MSLVDMAQNDADALRRRVEFYLVGPDGKTPISGETGQPQIMVVTAAVPAWSNVGIGVLTSVGQGRHYATLTQAAINIANGSRIATRYASANTIECPGDTVRIVPFLPGDEMQSGSVRAVGTGTGIPVNDITNFNAGSLLLFTSGAWRGVSVKANSIAGGAGAMVITVAEDRTGYALGDRFVLIGEQS